MQDRFLCKFHTHTHTHTHTYIYIYVLQSWFSVWRLIRRRWGPADTNKRLHSLVKRDMHTEIFKSCYNIYNLQLPNSLVTTDVHMNGFGRSLHSLQDTIERRCQAWRTKILQHCLRRWILCYWGKLFNGSTFIFKITRVLRVNLHIEECVSEQHLISELLFGLGLGGIVDPEQGAGYVCCDAHCSGVGSLCHQLDWTCPPLPATWQCHTCELLIKSLIKFPSVK